jgi:hypothetical protein
MKSAVDKKYIYSCIVFKLCLCSTYLAFGQPFTANVYNLTPKTPNRRTYVSRVRFYNCELARGPLLPLDPLSQPYSISRRAGPLYA